MLGSSLLVGLAAPFLVAARAELSKRATVSTTDITLYAYGTGIGGVPILYSEGLAYAGDASLLDDPNAVPVLFNVSEKHLQGSPNTTLATTEPNWSNMSLYIPTTDNSHVVGFTNSTAKNDSIWTDGFFFYGPDLFYITPAGKLTSSWYAVPTSSKGLWTLNWNNTENVSGAISVSLRYVSPSTTSSSS